MSEQGSECGWTSVNKVCANITARFWAWESNGKSRRRRWSTPLGIWRRRCGVVRDNACTARNAIVSAPVTINSPSAPGGISTPAATPRVARQRAALRVSRAWRARHGARIAQPRVRGRAHLDVDEQSFGRDHHQGDAE